MILSIVKISGAIIAEVGSAYLLVQAPSVKLSLAFFLGMSVVANIDNIMAMTVTDVNIGVEMSKETIQYSRNGQESFRGDWLEI